MTAMVNIIQNINVLFYSYEYEYPENLSSSTWKVPATYACPYTDHPDWCNSFHSFHIKTLPGQDLDIRGGPSVRKSDFFRAYFGGYVPKSDLNVFSVINQTQFPTMFLEQTRTWTKHITPFVADSYCLPWYCNFNNKATTAHPPRYSYPASQSLKHVASRNFS